MLTPDADNDPAVDSLAVSIGKAIKVVRTDRGWTRSDLARQADISYSYLGHIETGRQFPSAPVLVRIAEALNLRPSELLARAEGGNGAADEDQPERTLGELGKLVNRMSPGDQERLLDLARRLAH